MPRNPKRRPQQERARQTVDRIVDATARVLERDGYRAATTNRVAAEAGVSPGSLYQYFDDRDDLLVAVTVRFVERFEERLVPALRASAVQDPLSAIATMVETTVDALEDQARLLRALVARVPGERQEAITRSIRARLTDHVFQTLAARRADLDPAQLERVTWTVVELAQALPVRWVLDRPSIAREDFVADTTRLIAWHALGSVPAEPPSATG